MIIGDIKRERIEEKLSKTDEEINYTQYTRIEWNRMEEEDLAFYHRVEKDKIRIK